MSKQLVEGLKEAGRVALISALPVTYLAIEAGYSWKAVAVAALVSALKGIDKWMHKDPVVPFKGLLPF